MNKKIKWYTTTKKVKDLKLSEYNPRKINSEQKKQITESIKRFGKVTPLVVNIGSRNNIVVGGNQRLKIYKELDIKEVEVMIPNSELSFEEEQELNLRLNKNQAEWDFDLLQGFNMDLLFDVGFKDDEVNYIFNNEEVVEDDFDFKKEVKGIQEPIIKNGDIWQLGNHRLLVGDSTDKKMMKKLLENNKANIVYADPPYNIGLDYSKGISGKNSYGGNYSKEHDSQSYENYKNFLLKSITTARCFSKENSHFFYWCDAEYIGLIQEIYRNENINFKRLITWIKNNQNPTPSIAFNKVCEHAVYGTIGKPYLNKNHTKINEIMNQKTTTGNNLHEEIEDMINLWVVKRDSANSYRHPTQKPVSLNEKAIKRCSAINDIVLSLFGGSGSDLMACEQLQRRWFGIEKDSIFATVIIKRWEKFTGKKAKLLTNHKT